MKKIQLIGLGLIVVCGAISQWTGAKHYPWMVWVLALLAVAGMIMVMSEWFSSSPEE